MRGGSVRTGELQVIWVKSLLSPRECNPKPHSQLTGERVCRARNQNGRKDAAPGPCKRDRQLVGGQPFKWPRNTSGMIRVEGKEQPREDE